MANIKTAQKTNVKNNKNVMQTRKNCHNKYRKNPLFSISLSVDEGGQRAGKRTKIKTRQNLFEKNKIFG